MDAFSRIIKAVGVLNFRQKPHKHNGLSGLFCQNIVGRCDQTIYKRVAAMSFSKSLKTFCAAQFLECLLNRKKIQIGVLDI